MRDRRPQAMLDDDALDLPVPARPRQFDRGRHHRDPQEHRRRARARPAADAPNCGTSSSPTTSRRSSGTAQRFPRARRYQLRAGPRAGRGRTGIHRRAVAARCSSSGGPGARLRGPRRARAGRRRARRDRRGDRVRACADRISVRTIERSRSCSTAARQRGAAGRCSSRWRHREIRGTPAVWDYRGGLGPPDHSEVESSRRRPDRREDRCPDADFADVPGRDRGRATPLPVR